MASSSKRTTGNKQDLIKLDDELRRWVEALKAHYGTGSDADAIKRAVLEAHPNIREVAS